MNLEELKKLLENGAITKEQFDGMVSALNLGSDPEPKDPDPEPQDPEPLDYDKIEKLIQARVDKQLAAERKKTVDLKKQLERLQKSKLTDDELKQVELDEKENAIAEREKAITEKENRLFAVKAIKEAGLDDGSDTSLSLIDFVMGADEEEIKEKVWQCVEDKDVAWHCGAKKYYHAECRNANAIGVEMCNSVGRNLAVEKNTAELVRYLMDKYNIDIDHVVRHYDVTLKDCPKTFLDNSVWEKFKLQVMNGSDDEMTEAEKAKVKAIDDSLTNLYGIVKEMK